MNTYQEIIQAIGRGESVQRWGGGHVDNWVNLSAKVALMDVANEVAEPRHYRVKPAKTIFTKLWEDTNNTELFGKAVFEECVKVADRADLTGVTSIELRKHFGILVKPKQWYPDDSGEWIEYDGTNKPTNAIAKVVVLVAVDREDKNWRTNSTHHTWSWTTTDQQRRIVAYKFVN